jgi:hypothetical protein
MIELDLKWNILKYEESLEVRVGTLNNKESGLVLACQWQINQWAVVAHYEVGSLLQVSLG